MKDDWRVLDPALPPEPVPGASLEKAAAEALAAGDDLENMRFLEGELCGLSGKNLDVRGCVFERCRFGENDLKRVSFVDCVFDRCEWSNARLENAALQRVGFRGCRMTGLEALGGALMSAAFEGGAQRAAGRGDRELTKGRDAFAPRPFIFQPITL